jgi:hypothetical protein
MSLEDLIESTNKLVSALFSEGSQYWEAGFPNFSVPLISGAVSNSGLGGERMAAYSAALSSLDSEYLSLSNFISVKQASNLPEMEEEDREAYLKDRRKMMRTKLEVEFKIRQKIHDKGANFEKVALRSQIAALRESLSSEESDKQSIVFLDLEWLQKDPGRLATIKKRFEAQSNVKFILLSNKPYTESIEIQDKEIKALFDSSSVVYTNGVMQFPDVMDCLLENLGTIESASLFSNKMSLDWARIYGYDERGDHASLDTASFPSAAFEFEDCSKTDKYDEWTAAFFQQAIVFYMNEKNKKVPFLKRFTEEKEVCDNGELRLKVQAECYSHLKVPSFEVSLQIDALIDAIVERYADESVIDLLGLDVDGTLVMPSKCSYKLNGGTDEQWGALLKSLGASCFLVSNRSRIIGECMGLDSFMPTYEKTNPLPPVFLGGTCTKAYFWKLLLEGLQKRCPGKEIRGMQLEDNVQEQAAHEALGRMFEFYLMKQHHVMYNGETFETLDFYKRAQEKFPLKLSQPSKGEAPPYQREFLYGLSMAESSGGDYSPLASK